MGAPEPSPYAEASALHRKFTAELLAVRAAHEAAILNLAAGPEAPPPLTTAEAAAAMLEGRPIPNSGTAMQRLQLQEYELRQRLEVMTPMAGKLAEKLEIERARTRQAVLKHEPRVAQIRDGWRSVEAAIHGVLKLTDSLQRDLRAAELGQEDFDTPPWLVPTML